MKSMKYSAPLLLSAVICAPFTAAVADPVATLPGRDNAFSYTYLQGGVDVGNLRNPRADADTVYVEGSYAIDPNLHVRGGLGYYDGDVRRGGADIHGHRISAGLGFNTLLQNDLDFVASGDVVQVRAKSGGSSASDTGLELRGGVRHRTTDRLQLAGGAFHENIDRSDTGLYGEALFNVQQSLDVGARVQVGDDIGTVGLFGRYNF
ncbi:hypothetical protein K8B33_08690 [Alcanivorax sp. JB21]|uniref:hypothetical protein n=1 Tax=Alcanivorax limicola TaxID=2874102 RepID=UPI001CBCC79B|nr:hypothetical protein [Alcanivorax limicola]MBZ2189172.1 hypothetical protein [Alcanivorax limicola]